MSGNYTLEEIKKYNYVELDGIVYDLKAFSLIHPGGVSIIENNFGRRVGAIFKSRHPESYIAKLDEFIVGVFKEEDKSDSVEPEFKGLSFVVENGPRKCVTEQETDIPISTTVNKSNPSTARTKKSIKTKSHKDRKNTNRSNGVKQKTIANHSNAEKNHSLEKTDVIPAKEIEENMVFDTVNQSEINLVTDLITMDSDSKNKIVCTDINTSISTINSETNNESSSLQTRSHHKSSSSADIFQNMSNDQGILETNDKNKLYQDIYLSEELLKRTNECEVLEPEIELRDKNNLESIPPIDNVKIPLWGSIINTGRQSVISSMKSASHGIAKRLGKKTRRDRNLNSTIDLDLVEDKNLTENYDFLSITQEGTECSCQAYKTDLSEKYIADNQSLGEGHCWETSYQHNNKFEKSELELAQQSCSQQQDSDKSKNEKKTISQCIVTSFHEPSESLVFCPSSMSTTIECSLINKDELINTVESKEPASLEESGVSDYYQNQEYDQGGILVETLDLTISNNSQDFATCSHSSIESKQYKEYNNEEVETILNDNSVNNTNTCHEAIENSSLKGGSSRNSITGFVSKRSSWNINTNALVNNIQKKANKILGPVISQVHETGSKAISSRKKTKKVNNDKFCPDQYSIADDSISLHPLYSVTSQSLELEDASDSSESKSEEELGSKKSHRHQKCDGTLVTTDNIVERNDIIDKNSTSLYKDLPSILQPTYNQDTKRSIVKSLFPNQKTFNSKLNNSVLDRYFQKNQKANTVQPFNSYRQLGANKKCIETSHVNSFSTDSKTENEKNISMNEQINVTPQKPNFMVPIELFSDLKSNCHDSRCRSPESTDYMSPPQELPCEQRGLI